MTARTEDRLPTPTVRRPPNDWVGFLLTLLFSGGGFAYIGRLWPTLLLAVGGNLVVGSFARLVFGPGVDRWGIYLWLLLVLGSLVGYRNTYRAQYVEGRDAPRPLPRGLRFLEVWLGLLIFVVIRAGYAGGWLPAPRVEPPHLR